MNQDEHQRERMRAWVSAWVSTDANISVPGACLWSDTMLTEFDKRFPAPAAVEVAPALPKAIASTQPMSEHRKLMEWKEHLQLKELRLEQQEALLADELTTLREKARYWDAVRSGKVRCICNFEGMFAAQFDKGEEMGWQTSYYPTAEEAVQAAIDAGALK